MVKISGVKNLPKNILETWILPNRIVAQKFREKKNLPYPTKTCIGAPAENSPGIIFGTKNPVPKNFGSKFILQKNSADKNVLKKNSAA